MYGESKRPRACSTPITDNVDLYYLTSHTRVPNVDIVPASPWLVGVDKALAGEVGAETLLRTAFAQLPTLSQRNYPETLPWTTM